MGNHQQSAFQAVTAWVMAVLILCSPVLAHAHAWQLPQESEPVAQMPCHQDEDQQAVQPACPHCDKGGLSLLCDCCDQALSPTLLSQPDLQPGLFLPLGGIGAWVSIARPDPPVTDLYRPPIAS